MERPEYVEVAACLISMTFAGMMMTLCTNTFSVGCGYVMVAA